MKTEPEAKPHPLFTARTAAGLSQTHVAQTIGRSQDAISRIESGVHKPSLKTARLLVQHFPQFGLTETDLLYHES